MAQSLFALMHIANLSFEFLVAAIQHELDKTASAATLFRQSGFATAALHQFLKLHGGLYVQSKFKACYFAIVQHSTTLETEREDKVGPGESLRNNRVAFTSLLESLLKTIFSSIHSFPKPIRVLLLNVRQLVRAKDELEGKHKDKASASSSPTSPRSSLGRLKPTDVATVALVFLLFLCPALLHPVDWGLSKSKPSPLEQKKLVLVVKALQKLANGKPYASWAEVDPAFGEHNEKMQHGITDFIKMLPTMPPDVLIVERAHMLQLAVSDRTLLEGLKVLGPPVVRIQIGDDAATEAQALLDYLRPFFD
eukprot:g64945.t1